MISNIHSLHSTPASSDPIEHISTLLENLLQQLSSDIKQQFWEENNNDVPDLIKLKNVVLQNLRR